MNIDLTFQYPHPPTNEEAIADFEKELGFRLPEDYRQFLLKYNGGDFPSRRGYDYKEDDGTHMESGVIAFFGLDVGQNLNIRKHQNIRLC
jgi:cell wall assembly regulator SMI1